MASSLKIFTPCWGKKHLSLLSNCLGVSLHWPKNFKAIAGAEWLIICDKESEALEAKEILEKFEFDCVIRPIVIPGISGSSAGGALVSPLLSTIRECIDSKSYFLMATPDFIFGEGTIDSFKVIGAEYGTCVSIAHMRVRPEILKEIGRDPVTNSKLMSYGFRYPHPSWTHFEAGKRPNATYVGGVRWFDLGNHTVGVQHHLTSPFYVSFLESDIDVFAGRDSGGMSKFMLWDHIWPHSLFKYGRFRYIGSSDAAMMLEVTEPESNMPMLSDFSGCSKNAVHNQIQKQFISVFRGE